MFEHFRKSLGLLCIALLSTCAAFAAEESGGDNTPPKDATLMYVGTFTGTPANSKGIYLFWFRPADAQMTLTPLGVAAGTASPAFMALDAKRRLLFCANETDSFDGKPGGAVSSFSIQP